MKNTWLLDHLKCNIQMCPYCFEKYSCREYKLVYNVIWRKKLSKGVDLWKCRNCKREFRLSNKYQLYIYNKNRVI